MQSAIHDFLGSDFNLRTNVPLAPYTTYRIGGPAEVFVETGREEDILRLVQLCRKHSIPLTILGLGSNVLVPDEGIEGLVLRVVDPGAKPELDGDVLDCPAACSDETLARFAASHGCAGFGFLYDIPGAVGGAIVQNAAMDVSIADKLLDVTFVDARGELRRLPLDSLHMGYRTSLFKHEWGVVLGARFDVSERKPPEELHASMEAVRTTRRSKYPMEFPNCGSVFKRPEGDYAGRLIEAAELGGLRVGGAAVSTKHHNFIVNDRNATAEDIRRLVEEVRTRVRERFDVELERELIYLSGKGILP